MFEIRCVGCKHFNEKDLSCAIGENEDSCQKYQKLTGDTDRLSCEGCAWHSDGFCDFDLSDPNTCRRFKDKNDDL